MKYRMAAALLSLVGLLVAGYLYLYKIGMVGTMVCGTGSCELVQTSQYSRFVGIEVSLIGVIGYLLLLAGGLAWLQSDDGGRRWPGKIMLALSAGGLLFSAYLTYLELFVIHAICRWCVSSAVIVLAIFVTSFLGRRPAPASIA